MVRFLLTNLIPSVYRLILVILKDRGYREWGDDYGVTAYEISSVALPSCHSEEVVKNGRSRHETELHAVTVVVSLLKTRSGDRYPRK